MSACIFPVTNTLFLPGEVFTFWLEHVLLLAIPVYLLIENISKPEDFTGISSIFTFYGYYYIYNLLICQPLTMLTKANVNNVLCPAITDPFAGPHYRLHTLWHQFGLGLFGAKIFGILGTIINLTIAKSIKAD